MQRFAFVLLLVVAGGSAIPFEDCGSLYDLREVVIDGCPRAPCSIVAAEYINVTTLFYAGFSSERLENHVYFFIDFIASDAVVSRHTCQTSNSSCVVVNGELQQYVAEVYVNDDLPPTTGQLVWQIYNERNQLVMCFKVPVRVTM